jgi:hypothetical protein
MLAAWLTMARIVMEENGFRPLLTIPPACDDYLGTWINGPANREHNDIKPWLLSHKVPCFIAHTLTTAERCDLTRLQILILPLLLLGTNVKFLTNKYNEYDQIASCRGHLPTVIGPTLQCPQPHRHQEAD